MKLMYLAGTVRTPEDMRRAILEPLAGEISV
jgi:hypothetical protein